MHETTDCYDLVIVGGGQAAKALLMLLAERGMGHEARRPHTRVAIFERAPEIGPGVAWSPEQTLAEHLSSQPGGAPRADYGREQLRMLPRLVETLRAVNVVVDLFSNVEIVDLHREGTRWIVVGEEGGWQAKSVVLATGHWRNTPDDLANVPHHYPWPARKLQQVVLDSLPPDARVAVLGSYHTAIDTALTIALAVGRFERHGDRLRYEPARAVKTTLFSRGGRLPLVWPPTMVRHQPRESGNAGQPVRLEQLMSTISRELPGVPRPLSATQAASRLARLLDKLYLPEPLATLDRSLHTGSWRPGNLQRIAAMATLLPQISEQFPFLDADSYLRFQRKHRTSFFNVAMPMARATAERISALMHAGLLTVERIEDRRWQVIDRKPALAPAQPDGDRGKTRRFDLLVNGLASCGPIDRHPARLIRSLLTRQLIMPAYREFAADHPHRAGEMLAVDGVQVNPKTCEVVPTRAGAQRGTAAYRLYAMGPNLGGLFLDAQSIGQLARDARRIVADLGTQFDTQGATGLS